MLQPIKNWLLDNALLVAILISFAVIILSLINPSLLSVSSISVSDKLLHGLAYTGLIWSWLFVFRNKRTLLLVVSLVISLFIFGMILEFIQGEFTTNRTADWLDVVANTEGILFGLISFPFLYRFLFKR